MNLDFFLKLISFGVIAYFLLVNLFYILMFILSFVGLVKHKLRQRFATPNEIKKAKITPPISILAPAFGEELTIVASINSLLALRYGLYEVIVINDGSPDKTLEIMKDVFKLRKLARKYIAQIPTKPVKAIYRSEVNKRLIVIDKENGGKADSLNAGINVSNFPLFCCIDADSVLEPDSLLQIVYPFMENYSEVIAVGGLVRVANGCDIKEGEVNAVRTSDKWIVNFQIVEYLRAFLTGRVGLSMINALLIISGAFGLFKKETVVEVGGYRTDIVGEDMELVVRMHKIMRQKGKPCLVQFIPDPVCWTEVPETYKILGLQRNRWQRGLSESLTLNLNMLGNPRYGFVGTIAMPYFFFVEWLSPVIEIGGYLVFSFAIYRGAVEPFAFGMFFLLSAVFGMILSMLSLSLEEIAFRRYPRVKDLLKLALAGIFENFGYRQYMAVVRTKGLIDWARGQKSWGKMERTGIG